MKLWSCASTMIMFVGMVPVSEVHGDFIVDVTASTTSQSDGSYLYDYVLSDSASSDLPAVELNLATAADANLSSLIAPVGWMSAYSAGDTSITWFPEDVSFAIQSGDTGEFSFVSVLPPVPGDVSVLGFDPSTFAFDSSSGIVAAPLDAPASVPEPSTFALFLMGAACGLSHVYMRRSHRC